jgi:hypothetical protein
VGDVIKSIFIIIGLVLLAGQVSAAYTPEQRMTIEGMNLSYQLGTAHEKAIRGENVTEFNTLVDIYNAWVREHFAGEGANALLMSKITATNLPGVVQKQQVMTENIYPILIKIPFNASGDLSNFGKQRVKNAGAPGQKTALDNAIVEQKMKNL